jgi:hypothetical protein
MPNSRFARAAESMGLTGDPFGDPEQEEAKARAKAKKYAVLSVSYTCSSPALEKSVQFALQCCVLLFVDFLALMDVSA